MDMNQSDDALASPPFWVTLKNGLLQSFRFQLPFIVYVLCYMVLLLVVALNLGVYDDISFVLYSVLPLVTLVFVVAFLLSRCIYITVFVRPPNVLWYLRENLKKLFLERFVVAVPILLFFPIFMSVFTTFKSLIPLINPYSWDPAFAQMDAVIHGGIQPWVLLHSLITIPKLTYYINFGYNAWFFIMFAVINWQVFSLSNPKLRMQFFLSFLLTWSVLGSGLGTLLASGGPCYYELIVGDSLYVPLMDTLRAIHEQYPVWALETQDILWAASNNTKVTLGSGISAMPSMHVASALLFALVGCRSHWLCGAVLSSFFVLIMIGSVHLAWHYAVDGYVSIILTSLIWFVVGKVVERLPLPEPKISS